MYTKEFWDEIDWNGLRSTVRLVENDADNNAKIMNRRDFVSPKFQVLLVSFKA